MSVRQNTCYRWLEIDGTIQTVMDLDCPHLPVLPHLHGMLLSLYYQESEPQKVVELGLGGGALQRFIRHHFPNTHFHSIELSERVIEYYLQFFSDGITTTEKYITQGDAQVIVQQQKDIDLLFIDLFSGNAPPHFINDRDFYQNCFNSLNDQGLIIINLLPVGEIQTLDVEDLLRCVGGFSPSIFSIPKYKNRILVAAKRPLNMISFTPKLQKFSERFGINLMNLIQLK